MYICVCSYAAVIFCTVAKWIKGANGQSCDQVCNAQGLTCDASKQSELTSDEAVAAAFKEAGYTCKSFVPTGRDYPGTPYSTGRAHDDCVALRAGAFLCVFMFVCRYKRMIFAHFVLFLTEILGNSELCCAYTSFNTLDSICVYFRRCTMYL